MSNDNTINFANTTSDSTALTPADRYTAAQLSEFYERQSRRYGGGVGTGGGD